MLPILTHTAESWFWMGKTRIIPTASFILSMTCVSGDDLQVVIRRREDIMAWLVKLDHEGSCWSVMHCIWNTRDAVLNAEDITDEILHESQKVGMY